MNKLEKVLASTILTILGAITVVGIGFIIVLSSYMINQSDVQAAIHTEAVETFEAVPEVAEIVTPTLSPYESYLHYSHVTRDGYWFYYNDDTDHASVFVDFTTLSSVNPNKTYVGTFYDAEHWELESIRTVE